MFLLIWCSCKGEKYNYITILSWCPIYCISTWIYCFTLNWEYGHYNISLSYGKAFHGGNIFQLLQKIQSNIALFFPATNLMDRFNILYNLSSQMKFKILFAKFVRYELFWGMYMRMCTDCGNYNLLINNLRVKGTEHLFQNWHYWLNWCRVVRPAEGLFVSVKKPPPMKSWKVGNIYYLIPFYHASICTIITHETTG